MPGSSTWRTICWIQWHSHGRTNRNHRRRSVGQRQTKLRSRCRAGANSHSGRQTRHPARGNGLSPPHRPSTARSQFRDFRQGEKVAAHGNRLYSPAPHDGLAERLPEESLFLRERTSRESRERVSERLSNAPDIYRRRSRKKSAEFPRLFLDGGEPPLRLRDVVQTFVRVVPDPFPLRSELREFALDLHDVRLGFRTLCDAWRRRRRTFGSKK
jgi:hypothetical protein